MKTASISGYCSGTLPGASDALSRSAVSWWRQGDSAWLHLHLVISVIAGWQYRPLTPLHRPHQQSTPCLLPSSVVREMLGMLPEGCGAAMMRHLSPASGCCFRGEMVWLKEVERQAFLWWTLTKQNDDVQVDYVITSFPLLHRLGLSKARHARSSVRIMSAQMFARVLAACSKVNCAQLRCPNALPCPVPAGEWGRKRINRRPGAYASASCPAWNSRRRRDLTGRNDN